MARGRYQQKQWDARQEAILKALEGLFAERGLAAVTMDDLAETVGISKATLYQHFASKDAMLAHLLAEHYAQFAAWLESTTGQPPLERLCATMRYLMSGQFVALRDLMTLDRDEVVPVFQGDPALLAGHTQTLGLLAGIVRQGQAEGSIAADLAPQAIIAAMWALSNLAPRQAPAFARLDGPLDEAAYAEQMLRLFARGLRPPDSAA